MYTKEQQVILKYTHQRVKAFFKAVDAPGHGYDHAERVAKWAVIIAKSEKADIFLSEICAVLHDIGRGLEKDNPDKTHHELSYELCREWFRQDATFDFFTKAQKLLILYSLRYHWNDAADKYKEAIVLRDADKIDALGKIGLKRLLEYCKHTGRNLSNGLRFAYHIAYWIRTKKARELYEKMDLLREFDAHVLKQGKKAVKKISL